MSLADAAKKIVTDWKSQAENYEYICIYEVYSTYIIYSIHIQYVYV